MANKNNSIAMSFWKLRVDGQLIATNFTSLIQSLGPQIKMLKDENKNYFLAKFVFFNRKDMTELFNY